MDLEPQISKVAVHTVGHFMLFVGNNSSFLL